MADDGHPTSDPPETDGPQQQRDDAEPPPLSSIRIKGGHGRGLNRRAIVLTAGGAAILVLVPATGVLAPSQSGNPAETRPMMSAPSALARARISWQGTITPMFTTSKLLHCKTTVTMFLPMSCTSPFTVAMMILPLVLTSPPAASRRV